MDHLSAEQRKVVDAAIDLILSLPKDAREDACHAIRYNEIVCMYCGYGDRERPNDHCQCMNDC